MSPNVTWEDMGGGGRKSVQKMCNILIATMRPTFYLLLQLNLVKINDHGYNEQNVKVFLVRNDVLTA